MAAYKSIIATVIFIVASVSAKSFQNTKDVVWFPNPNGDGSLLEAKLTPDPNFKIGNLSDVHFLLYTGNNQNTPDELFAGNDASLTNSHFIPNRPLKFLIHGFGGAFTHTFPWQTYQEYLKVDSNQNFILVNWTVLADNSNYFGAVQNAQLVSQAAADLIEFLIAEQVVRREDIHLIGFSLGGQVVGQIGSRVAEKLTRITALDPALPLFDVADLHNRTDPSDAVYVNVVHTAGILLGFNDPCGTVDWFPNGGLTQPGCGVDLTGSCAHSRAPAFFLEALLSETEFRGRKCTSWNDFTSGRCDENEVGVMSYNTPETTTGVFYLRTNAESPFAQG
ncbi:Pancreatic triacylglycerol lipase [Orchesella cincta]|uniref:Pancreatic triacylglycerol lipase n=1 Tax=Orchesella cincta TaxID=48709 RepID=A0A1D2NM36_ORCCI|nr:Pancreatic triacylglycerol lipase [Orchesella cincta]